MTQNLRPSKSQSVLILHTNAANFTIYNVHSLVFYRHLRSNWAKNPFIFWTPIFSLYAFISISFINSSCEGICPLCAPICIYIYCSVCGHSQIKTNNFRKVQAGITRLFANVFNRDLLSSSIPKKSCHKSQELLDKKQLKFSKT